MSKQVILTIPDSVDLSALREMKVILHYYKDGNDLYEYSTDSFSLSEAKGDLISRIALKKDIEENAIELGGVPAIEVDCVKALIDIAPTVAVDEEIERQREELYQSSKKLFDTARMLGIERPKGWWVEVDGYDGDTYYECDQCGEPWELIAGTPKDNGMNFCPNCGADMRGEENAKT